MIKTIKKIQCDNCFKELINTYCQLKIDGITYHYCDVICSPIEFIDLNKGKKQYYGK